MNEIPSYWTEPNIGKFQVTIKSVEEINNRYRVTIKEKVIRPAGGGQAGDRGCLRIGTRSAIVYDTIVDSEDIFLVTDNALPEGEKGQLEIDMDWRFSMMRNHTAEHLFVSIIKKRYEDVKVGQLWIDGKHGSVELTGVELDFDSIFEVEREVMNIIDQDIPIINDFVDSSSIDESVRTREGLTEKHAKLRVVRVGDLDSSACSGIHVTRTRDIGFFKVIDAKGDKNSTHVEFVSGLNAAKLVSNIYNVILQRRYSYPFEMEQLGAVLDRAKLAVDDKQKMVEKITDLLSHGSSVEQIADISFRYEYLPGYDAASLKNLANQLQMTGPAIVLLFAPGRKSQAILRVNELSKEASHYISKPLKDLGGKGGGKGEVFIGGFLDVEDPMWLYGNLVDEIRKVIS